jgi:hypothetical protein
VRPKDPSLDSLLDLDGDSYALDGLYWVKFEAKRVPVSSEKPHGLNYPLTLHDDRGARLLGYDNAHGIQEGPGPGARTRIEYDHKHKGQRVRFYHYTDAVTLLADFWTDVDAILQEGEGKG